MVGNHSAGSAKCLGRRPAVFAQIWRSVLIVFGIGWIIASGIGKITANILKKINFDSLFSKSGWKAALENAEIKVYPSEFFGAILKWILVIVFLQIFVEILGLNAFVGLFNQVLGWLPNVIVARDFRGVNHRGRHFWKRSSKHR